MCQAQLVLQSCQGAGHSGRGQKHTSHVLHGGKTARMPKVECLSSSHTDGGLQADLGTSVTATEAVSIGILTIA